MSKWTFIIFIIFLNFTAHAEETVSLSTESLKDLIQNKNLKVEAAQIQKKGAEARAGHLLRSFTPSAEIFVTQENFTLGSSERRTQPSYGGEMKFNIFNGGKDSIEDKLRNKDVERLKYNSEKIVKGELLRAREIYWLLSFNRKKIDLLNKNRELNKTHLAEALKRIRKGVSTDSDRFEFEMKEADLKRDIKETEIESMELERELRLILNLPPEKKIFLTEDLGHEHDFMKELQVTSIAPTPSSLEQKIEAEQRELSASMAKRSFWPQIEAYAGFNQYNQREKETTNEDDRKDTYMGLRIKLNIPEGASSYAEAESLQSQSLVLRKEIEIENLNTESKFKQEVRRLQFLHDEVHEAELNIIRADRYYKLTQAEYTRGVKNSPDILGAADKLYERQYKYYEILKQFLLTRNHALFLIGK